VILTARVFCKRTRPTRPLLRAFTVPTHMQEGRGIMFGVVLISFRIMQTMQSDVDVEGAFVRGSAHGKEKLNWLMVDR
jgi:hypothetical protein